MLTQSPAPNIQNQLILEHPNTTESYYSLCNFKERQESLAVEKLRGFDEITNSGKALYHKCFGFSSCPWKRPKNNLQSQYEDLQEDGDGIALIYKKLSLEDKRLRHTSKANVYLSGWEVCGTQLHYKVDYLKEKLKWKDNTSTRKADSKTESLSHSTTFNPKKKEGFVQSKLRNCEFVEPKETKRDVQPSPTYSEEGPCTMFHQFANPNDHIKYYRDNVTHNGIKKHFFSYVEGMTCKYRPQTFPLVKRTKSQVKRESPGMIYRFHISDNTSSFGILKVGPCPSLKTRISPKKGGKNEALGSLVEETVSEVRKSNRSSKGTDCIEVNVNRLLGDQSSYSLSAKKAAKSRQSYSIPTANTTDFDEAMESKEDDESKRSDDMKVKKVGLRVNKKLAPKARTRNKGCRFNKSKQNQTSMGSKTNQGTSRKRAAIFSKFPATTLGEKEFLRITKPKVIGVNPASQKGSCVKFTSSHDLEASAAMYPWNDEEIDSIPKGRIIETNHFISQDLIKSRLPEKGFQVCITPSSYPRSTVGVKMRLKEEAREEDCGTCAS